MPLCGKTTWIKKHNLHHYTIDFKKISNAAQSPRLDISGRYYFHYPHQRIQSNMIFELLKWRMENGDFTIIENLHITQSFFSNYQQLAKAHRYKIIIVDFSHVPLSEIKARNKEMKLQNPLEYYHYTDEEILSLYDKLLNTKIPIPYETIKPDDINSLLATKPKDLSKYKRIYHIGDIHGSFSVLKEYLGNIRDDCFYIFLGDYIDRGLQNHEVLNFLIKIMNNHNVYILEGNHERHLWNWVHNRESSSREFRLNTQAQIEKHGIPKEIVKNLCLTLKPNLYYKFHDKYILCTHGGLPNIPDKLAMISASEFIYGTGTYMQTLNIAKSFTSNTNKNQYQVFGHRNREDLPANLYDRNYVLEAKVEKGGFLRALELDESGFHEVSIANKHFMNPNYRKNRDLLQKEFESMQRNDYISKIYIGYLVSFSPINNKINVACAFEPYIVDTETWKIFARGKNNTHSTSQSLQNDNQINYPITILASKIAQKHFISYYDECFYYIVIKNGLSISKEIPKNIILNESNKEEIISLLQEELGTRSFCLEIGVDKSYCLINIFANEIETKEASYKSLQKIANLLQIDCITQIAIINSAQELRQFTIMLQNKQKLIESLKKSLKHEDSNEYKNIENSMESKSTYINPSNLVKIPNKIREDLYLLKALGEFSSIIKTQPFLFWNIIAVDSSKSIYNFRSFISNEYQAIEHILGIWVLHGCIEKLVWINTPLREIFYFWFIEKMKDKSDLLKKDMSHIWSLFLDFIYNINTN